MIAIDRLLAVLAAPCSAIIRTALLVRSSARATAREDHLAVHTALEGDPIKHPFSFTGQGTVTVSVGIADSMQALPLNVMDGALPGPIHDSSPHQPHPTQPQAQNSPEESLQSKLAWHKLWNPLKLDAPATPFDRPKMLFLYAFICQARQLVFPIFTLLVLLGDPIQDNLAIVQTAVSAKSKLSLIQILYLVLLSCGIIHCWLFCSIFMSIFDRTRAKATFFKVVLANEYKCERKEPKAIACFMLLLYAGGIVAVNWKGQQNAKECEKDPKAASNEFCQVATLPADAPHFSGLTYWILISAFMTAFYEVFSYNDVFNDIMFPESKDIREQYPGEFKTAGDSHYSCCQFEPNIPIQPDTGFWLQWLVTDTNTVLTSVIIVCDRVIVHLNTQSEVQESTELISAWRSKFDEKSAKHKAINDSSLGWGFVSVHPCILFATLTLVPSRYIDHMTVGDVVKTHQFLHSGLTCFKKPKIDFAFPQNTTIKCYSGHACASHQFDEKLECAVCRCYIPIGTSGVQCKHENGKCDFQVCNVCSSNSDNVAVV